MGVELFKHNAVAYDKVKKMFETKNRACVIHPTGCGKSFIGLKWLEENKDKRAIFLAPTVSILRQITKHIESCGMSMEDFPYLKRYTYSKLSNMTEEEISKLDFDLILLDEFHRCGATEWSRGITSLINNNPNAKVLGFSATPIRYLDEHRDMAEELFSGNVASEIPLEDAMLDGILPIPTYINAVYSFKDDIESMQEKIKKEKREVERLQAQQYLDEAKKLLEKADGLPQIFKKHLRNKAGKYIVFCRNKEHMESMMQEAKDWFKEINNQIDIYSMASFIPKSENLKVFEEFYNSDNDNLKLLFSIDMLNEGVHVPNIDGVIMLRPTASPIIFKQQLGRALSVGHNANPLVFDIVNNVQSCEMVGNFYRELRERALVKFTQIGNTEQKEKIDAFQISDTVRQVKDIFSKIDNCLRISWDDYYNLAVEYYIDHENLLVPNNYSKNGMNLGYWIMDQRKTMKGNGHRKPLTEEQIQKLNAIGMVWDKFEKQWDETYSIAKEYYDKHGNLDISRGEIIKGKNIRQWLDDQIKLYNRGTLSEERIKLLEGLGIVWSSYEARWQEMYEVAKEHYEKYGTLAGKKDAKLKNWLQTQVQAYKGNKGYTQLSDDKIKKLEALGIIWNAREKGFSEFYEVAKKYYEEHGTLLMPDKYEIDGRKISSWIHEKRQAYKKGFLSAEQIQMLEEIGMIWDVREYAWNQMYEQAKKYYEEHGHLRVKGTANKKLKHWLKIQETQESKEDSLSEKRKEIIELTKIEDKREEKKVSRNEKWEQMYQKAKLYYEEHGDLLVSKNDRELGIWIGNQRNKYKLNKGTIELTEEQIEKLESIGMIWDTIEYRWNAMYAEAKLYYEKYGSLTIPDNMEEEYKQLRTWIQDQKRKYKNQKTKYKNQKLSKEQIEKLENIGIVWNFSETAWENMFEKAKAYYEEHGDLFVPKNDPELGGWIGAQRQKYKTNKQESKLTEAQIERLESIGMIWNTREYNWNVMYAQAKLYYETYGSLSFPSERIEQYKQLNTWVVNMRRAYYGKGTCSLTEEREQQLRAIGVIQEERLEQEESLEELESELQGLVEKKKDSSKLVSDFERVKKSKSANKGVEK